MPTTAKMVAVRKPWMRLPTMTPRSSGTSCRSKYSGTKRRIAVWMPRPAKPPSKTAPTHTATKMPYSKSPIQRASSTWLR